jgi:hypothetical protein
VKKIIVLAFVAALAAPAAFAETSTFDIGVLGGLNANSSSSSPSSLTEGSKGKFAPTFGVTSTYALTPELGLGVDLLMAKRKQGADGTEATQSYTALQLPVTLRYTGIQYFQIGAGPYYSMAMGDITSDNGSGGTATTTFEDANMKKSDFGLAAVARGWYPIAPQWNLVGDLRYLMGLSNQIKEVPTGVDASVKSKDFQILVGATYAM